MIFSYVSLKTVLRNTTNIWFRCSLYTKEAPGVGRKKDNCSIALFAQDRHNIFHTSWLSLNSTQLPWRLFLKALREPQRNIHGDIMQILMALYYFNRALNELHNTESIWGTPRQPRSINTSENIIMKKQKLGLFGEKKRAGKKATTVCCSWNCLNL